MSFSYKVKGLDKFIRRVQGKPKQARRAVSEVLRKSALRIERKAKIKAAVDTGFMRNGIFVARVGMLRYKVTSPAGYSVYVELGTRKMKAQPFLGPAVKEESGNLMIASEIKRLMPGDEFMVYSGDDGLTLPMLSVGGCGVISVVSHVAGKDMNAMIQAFEAGHNHEAIRLHQGLSEIIKAMFITTNPIPVKYAARKIGLPVGEFNLPMCEPTADEAAYIDKALTEYLQ